MPRTITTEAITAVIRIITTLGTVTAAMAIAVIVIAAVAIRVTRPMGV